MSGDGISTENRAAALREAFDASFARAPGGAMDAGDDLLAIRLGGDAYALRLAEVSGLFADKTVVGVPSPVAELRGLAGFRGAVVPVYDLGMLVGRAKASAPRWLVVAAGGDIAFAFDGFDGYLRARPDAVVREAGSRDRAGSVREVLQGDVVRPIVHLPSIVDALVTRAGSMDRS